MSAIIDITGARSWTAAQSNRRGDVLLDEVPGRATVPRCSTVRTSRRIARWRIALRGKGGEGCSCVNGEIFDALCGLDQRSRRALIR